MHSEYILMAQLLKIKDFDQDPIKILIIEAALHNKNVRLSCIYQKISFDCTFAM